MKFQQFLKKSPLKLNLHFEIDVFTNYPFDEFLPMDICKEQRQYSYYCYALNKCCRWLEADAFYLLRIMNIEMIDDRNFIFYCPAYKNDFDLVTMATKRKSVLTEPNKLGLTPGKLSIEAPELTIKLDNTNSYYDAKKKRRVPMLPEVIIDPKKQLNPKTQKKEKLEDGMVNNTDVQVEGKLHSSHFLSPLVCERLWTLSRGAKSGWAWYAKVVEGFKNKYEYYCRPIETEDEQYLRGGEMFSLAFLKLEFPELDKPEFDQKVLLKLGSQFEEKQVDSIQVVIDAMLCK